MFGGDSLRTVGRRSFASSSPTGNEPRHHGTFPAITLLLNESRGRRRRLSKAGLNRPHDRPRRRGPDSLVGEVRAGNRPGDFQFVRTLDKRPEYLREGAHRAPCPMASLAQLAPYLSNQSSNLAGASVADGNDVGEAGFVNVLGTIPMTRTSVSRERTGDALQSFFSPVEIEPRNWTPKYAITTYLAAGSKRATIRRRYHGRREGRR